MRYAVDYTITFLQNWVILIDKYGIILLEFRVY